MKKLFLVGAAVIAGLSTLSSCNSTVSQRRQSISVTDTSTVYTCTMHQQVIGNHPGSCPVCGMTLEKQKITPQQKRWVDEEKIIKADK